MRERPIRLKAHEVRAILSGAKSQTRHAVKPQPSIDASGNFCWNGINFGQDPAGRPLSQSLASQLPCSRTGRVHCPFGKIGDRLWVRETWQQVHPLQVAAGRYSHEGRAGIPGPPPVSYRTIYRADGEFPPIYMLGGEPWPYRSLTPFERNGMQSFVDDPWWNPSVRMPRWACRLVLEITDVRVERLQAISAADAEAEGLRKFPFEDSHAWAWRDGDRCGHASPTGAFRSLWTSTGGDWDANPWVWVISFTKKEICNGSC